MNSEKNIPGCQPCRNFRLLRRREKGQAVLEFVIMLVIAAMLALALLSLSGVVADDGERMIRLVRFDVP